MNQLQDLLDSRLLKSLAAFADRPLLADEVGVWTGHEITQKLDPLIKILEACTLPGSRVGICFPNWAVHAFAIMAVIIAKRVPVILSQTDVSKNPEFWLNETAISFLVTSEEMGAIEMHRLPVLGLNRYFEIKLNTTHNRLKFRMQDITQLPPHGTGLLLYTSGSTGQPKGIFVPSIGIVKTADYLIQYFNLNSSTVAPIVLPVCHSMALNTQFIPTFLAGGKCYFFNSRLGISKVFRTILDQKGTFISMIGDVLRTSWEEKRRRNLEGCTSVEHIQLAGGLIQPQHIQMARELFPNALVHKGYGLTEAIRVTMIDSNDPGFHSHSVGLPLDFQKIQIRRQDGSLANVNESGEIYISGPNVMLGVSGAKDDHLTQDGFLASGDIGFLNDKGQLAVAGRVDSIFKINGRKVSGFEIEQQVSDISPLVRDIKCVAVADEKRGAAKIAIFLEIPNDLQDRFFSEEMNSFQQKIWQKLNSLSHFPRDIVVLNRFPRTSNGKLRTDGLQKAWSQSVTPFFMGESTVNIKFFRETNNSNSHTHSFTQTEIL